MNNYLNYKTMKRIILPLLTILLLISCSGVAQTTYPVSADTVRIGRVNGTPTTTLKLTSYKNLSFPGTTEVLAVDNKGIVYKTTMSGGGGSPVNIYNTDGTLTGNRTLSGAGFDWINTGLKRFNVTSSNNNSFPPISLVGSQSGASYSQNAIHINGTGYNSKGVYIQGTSAVSSIGLSLYGLGSPSSSGVELKGEANGSSASDIDINAVNGKLKILGLGTDNSANEFLTRNTSNNNLVWRQLNSIPNIYNSDGTLTGNRTVNGGRHNLSFINNDYILLSAYDNATASPITIEGQQTLSGFGQDATYIHGVGYENKGINILGESLTGDYGASVYGLGIPAANGLELKGTSVYPRRDIVLNPVNGRVEFKNIPLDNQGDSVLTCFEGLLKWRQASSFSNIYGVDGTLTGNRILSGGNNKLTFNNLKGYTINSTGGSGSPVGMTINATGVGGVGILVNAVGDVGYNGMVWSGVSNDASGFYLNGENTGLNDAGLTVNGYSHDPTQPDILISPFNPVLGFGRISITELPTFIDDAAAGVGGLQTDMLYKTPTGVLMIKL